MADQLQRVLIVNGPHLDLLGTREPELYGQRSFEEFLEELRQAFPALEIRYFQSNVEGELVQALRDGARMNDAIVMNPAGYSHTSVALRDAIPLVGVPVVEVHISNIHAREDFRHNTLTGAVTTGVITGFGLEGYRLAIQYLLQRS
ncbi:MAG: type II 3-dehydroquinate dehydratase [Flavobacteriales bacterium]